MTRNPPLAPTHIAIAVAAALLHFSSAQAQTATPPANAASAAPATTAAAAAAAAERKQADSLNLDAVVVTGTSTKLSKMKQSVSVSSLDSEQIEKTGATSAAELLRSVPGLRAESSGGEGNANITVRGVPISAGGARYVQLQEDGLPVLLFGDIAFGTADQFLRADYNIDRLEVVRGGSASTLATNSPGGLVNFISKTGEEQGGAFALTGGVHPREFRVDADYGGKLGEKTTFHVGGFERFGEGGRPTGYNASKGGQIKANVTQRLDNGYVRLSLKALDDRTPTFLPVPVTVTNGTINKINGVDPRTAFFVTSALTRDVTLNKDGGFSTTNPHDGLHVKSTAIGAEAGFDLGDGWSVSDKFRKSSNSGRFMGLFPSDNGNNGASPTTFTGVLFNTSLDNFDNLFNELKVAKSLSVGGGKMSLNGGLFTGTQNVAETWFWNRYNFQLKGEGAAIVTPAGAPTSAPIGTGFTTFGGCCVRSWDVEYTQLAPFAALTYELGGLNIDASIRHDIQKASGFTVQGNATTQNFDAATQKNVNYKVSHNSYSLGANYALNKDLSLFGRASDGVSFSADRLLYGNPLDGSVPISLNKVKQIEAGAKWRSGPFSVFATFFNARTDESNYEVTTQTFTSNKYTANGLELEAAFRTGGFHVNGGLTYTRARIKGSNDATVVGNTPRRQADVVWQLTPGYSMAAFDVGASLVGTTKSFGDDGNTITMPGFVVVNPYVSYQFTPKVSLSVSANNVFNTVGYTEIEGDGHAARSVNGRSFRATVKYLF
jgi:outer membrane receptor protein involved in Fe transport